MNTSCARYALLATTMLTVSAPARAEVDRAIPLHGVVNTRDLGGLPAADGRTIRPGQLIRSGEIDAIDQEGKDRLDAMQVTTIVDLRTNTEATAHPAEWPEGTGPARYHFAVMERESEAIDNMRSDIKSGTATVEETDALFTNAFKDIPISYTRELRGFFDVVLAQPEGEALLYHCSGGKDRTGVMTALLLSALGVPREQIEADFMMSNTLKDADHAAVKIAAQVNAAHGTDMSAEAVWPSVGVRPDYLDGFYDSVTDAYGSVDNYLREGLGLTEADIKALRDRYLE